ncbi:MAG: hypothetical protein R2761_07160 [Acidimicrobiales bacterium]
MTSLPIAGPGRFSIYTGRVTNWPMVVISSALALPVLFMGLGSGDGAGGLGGLAMVGLLIAVGILLNIATASSVRVAAGPNGVTVRWGLVGWPRHTYRLADIERAEVIDLRWWWVSWGYWWTPKRTCCTVRSGPSLRFALRNGRSVTVSVPDPAAAVAAIGAAKAAQG